MNFERFFKTLLPINFVIGDLDRNGEENFNEDKKGLSHCFLSILGWLEKIQFALFYNAPC